MKRSTDAGTFLAKADRTLAAAKALLLLDNADGACNRAYYTMFHAAYAALLALADEVPESSIKTHRGLIAAFGKHLVQGGHFPLQLGSDLNKVERLRKIADYVGDPVTLADARAAVERADRFLTCIRQRLSQ